MRPVSFLLTLAIAGLTCACPHRTPSEQMQACGIAWQVAEERCKEKERENLEELSGINFTGMQAEMEKTKECKAKAERNFLDCREEIR